MRFTLKILAFTALLLIGKFTKDDQLITSPDENFQVIVSTALKGAEKPMPVSTSSSTQYQETSLPGKPMQILVATQATIK